MSADLRFDGRVAIVTGAGGGLGRAHARLLAARGARVVVNDVGASLSGEGADAGAAGQVMREIRDAGGEAIADVHSVLEGARIVETALEAFGRIDIVVNNAGILRDRAFHNMTDEEWDAVYRVHLDGAFKVTRAAWPHLRDQRYGRVVFTSSAAGLYGNFGQANYSAVKLAVVGLARALAVEGAARDIRVNAISPSAASRMSASILDERALEPLSPDLISPLVAYLCHESCPATGRVFAAGGGWIGEVREQQSHGERFDALTPERVADAWAQITDFAGATAPQSVNEGLAPIVAGLPEELRKMMGIGR